MYTAYTTTGGCFEDETWDGLVTRIGDWQGERVDGMSNPVEIVSCEGVTDDEIRKANKDFEVWFDNDREALKNDYWNENCTLWNNDGRA